MKDMQDQERIREFAGLWHRIFSSNKLNVCTEKLADVSPVEIGILRIVDDNPDVILREICKKLGIVNSTLTSAVNRLEKRKLVKRVISSRDLRSFGLELTEDGRTALSEHKQGEEQVLGTILNSLDSDQEKEEFVKLFRKVVLRMTGE